MKKQTAVEWLKEFMKNGEQKSEGIISLAFAKAKEMEKEQIMDAYNKGHFNGYKDIDKFDEQYYNETYKQDEQ